MMSEDNAIPYLQLTTEGGRLTIANPAHETLLADCWAAVILADGIAFTTVGPADMATGPDGVWLVQTVGDGARPALRWSIAPGEVPRSLRLQLEVENTTAAPLAVARLDVLAAPAGFRGAAPADLRLAEMGWQSWSHSTPPVPLLDLLPQAPLPSEPPLFSPTDRVRAQTWMALLEAPAGNLLAGFVTARDQLGAVIVQPVGAAHRLTLSSFAEGIALPPGATRRSEVALLLFDGPPERLLDQYGAALGTAMGARPWPTSPTGWCSWYHFFTAVTEDDMLRNLELLAAQRAQIPIEVVQLDDGYQQHNGDWLRINDKFPHGMRYLADRIRAHGYTPGIWLAPFIVSAASAVYAAHPDWVLRDAGGAPVNALFNWGQNNYALDTTNPAVADWLREVFTTIVHDWGYDYLKIDFLYAAAMPGRRTDPQMTTVQAYRRGLEIIREVAGDRFVLGCGAPLAASVGLVDGMRVGSDVAEFWRNSRDPFEVEPALRNAVRGTLTHAWMHERLWINDPDCVLLRQEDSQLTLAEVQAWAAVIALTGGMVLLSDDLSRLEADRRALIPLLLPPARERAVPLGPVVEEMPATLLLPVARPWGHWHVVGLFNWRDAAYAAEFNPAICGLGAEEAYHLFDLWSREYWGPQQGLVALGPTPAHGVRLLAVQPDRGRPQLLCTTLHLLGGVVEVTGETWADGVLRVTLACPGKRTGHLVIYLPPGYAYQPADQAAEVERRGNLLFVPVVLVGHAEVQLVFTPTDSQF